MTRSMKWRCTRIMMVLCSILALSSCTWFNRQSAPASPIAPQQETTGSVGEAPDAFAPRPVFYDFSDIPVPSELELLAKDSYVFQSGSLKAGLLTLKGRVDINSAISFFQMAMPRENWKPKGGFRYRRSVLIFEKPEKTCVINFYEKMFYTYVEIYVAPMAGQV